MTISLLAALWLTGLAPATPLAETPPRPDSVIGEVTALDPAARRLSVKTDAGEALEVHADDKTAYLRARPGSTALADAVPIRFEDVGVGDRVLARGRRAEDKASLSARQVVVMSHGDIAQKHDAERAEWRRRGVLGVVTAVAPGKGEITIQMRGFRGGQTILIPADSHTAFRRYAPDSVKFTDARPSSLAEVQVGDQLRALGERSPDGSRLVPEQVVFGTFRTLSGTVSEVDPARGELTVREEESRRPIRVAVGSDARLRRIPPELGTWRGRGREGPEDMLERLPATTLAEIKRGDRVLVSSTKGSDPARLNAIALVAGLEALAPSRMAGPRGARGPEGDLPPDLMDLGMSLP